MRKDHPRKRRTSRATPRPGDGAPLGLLLPVEPPTKRKFWIRVDVLVEVDTRLLADVLTDEWRADHYPLHTAGDVAVHLGYNLIQGSSVDSLDGFADQPKDHARVLDVDVDDVAEEVVDAPPEKALTKKAKSSRARPGRRP
jgi:hypothetical protein